MLLIFVLLLSVNAANSRPGTINSTHVKCLLAEFEVDLQSVKSHATSWRLQRLQHAWNELADWCCVLHIMLLMSVNTSIVSLSLGLPSGVLFQSRWARRFRLLCWNFPTVADNVFVQLQYWCAKCIHNYVLCKCTFLHYITLHCTEWPLSTIFDGWLPAYRNYRPMTASIVQRRYMWGSKNSHKSGQSLALTVAGPRLWIDWLSKA